MLESLSKELLDTFNSVFIPVPRGNSDNDYYISIPANDELGQELVNHFRSCDRVGDYINFSNKKFIFNKKVFAYDGYFISRNSKNDGSTALVVKFILETK